MTAAARMASGAAEPLLAVNDLSTHFRTDVGLVRAVDGVSLSLAPGRTLGLVGESGCGKSVLMRTILGLLPSTARIGAGAHVRFDGRDLLALPEVEMQRIRGREIAIVFQDPMSSLNPVLKVGKQIGETLMYHLGVSRGEARERAVELLRAVGIPSPARRVDEYPHQLSGGIRQRVAIAIALSCEPKLLIADEPTTALDVTVQAGILDLLQRQQEERHMAMVLITHDLGVVASRTQQIAVMYGGKIVEHAATEDIFADTRMPYTQALLDSIPRLNTPLHARLAAIPGAPPNLVHPPPGCRFAPRCAAAQDRCRAEEPPLVEDAATAHSYACWFPVGGGGQS